jgi:hypothetical protein
MDSENSSVGTDSFLDVITNFVGILIILVMVVGERARHAPLPKVARPADTELEAARAQASTIEGDVRRIAVQMEEVNLEMAGRARERDAINTLVTAMERKLGEHRGALDENSREDFDRKRDLALANDELAKLDRELRDAQATDAPDTITIESYPTPLGKTVDGKEAHYQLLGGRLTCVPFDALVDRLKSVMRDYASKMGTSSELVDTLGPVGGFRMRYVIERHDAPQGSYLQVAHIELLPVSNRLGEPVEDALATGSAFREKLKMMSPRQYTITVWTYPDSFAEFRRLKKELYLQGYAVAGRPLPEGLPIGASPQGSKSSAQ